MPTHSVLPSFIHSGHRGMSQVLCAGTQVGQSLPSGGGADLGTEVLPVVGSPAGGTRPLAHHNPRLGASRCYTGEGCKGPPIGILRVDSQGRPPAGARSELRERQGSGQDRGPEPGRSSLGGEPSAFQEPRGRVGGRGSAGLRGGRARALSPPEKRLWGGRVLWPQGRLGVAQPL